MIGETLNERYEIQERLGEGAFGEVFRATDHRLKRDVAVKLLHPSGGDGVHQRFLREAEAMANLSHANIATVHDFGEVGNRPFLVMEFIKGGALIGVCDELKADQQALLRLASQIAGAMAHAHEASLIHRDLTLKNILIDGEGRARVIDFGLAKLIDSTVISDASVMMGTPAYIAPEQAAGHKVDHRADIFAYGVCLYRMFNGRLPFEAEHPTSLLYQVMNEDPPEMDRAVPMAVQDIILKCLEKDPAHRYQSFDEVRADVERIRGELKTSQDPTTTQVSIIQAVPEPIQRNPYLNRVMIKNPDEFFGRKREVKRIYSRLDAPRPQSVAIVGERRIGKSSLLNYIYHRRNRRRAMQNHADSLFVYMDLQRAHEIDMPKFIDIMLSMIAYEAPGDISATSGDRSLDTLSAVVERLTENGKRVVVLLDEFEAVTANHRFEMQFFSYLRFLANSYRVAYVTSSYSDLQQMCHDKEIADSPFFNIFSNMPLRPFSREEAIDLITTPSQREGAPLAPHAEGILAMAGHHPFFVQIACSAAYESISEGSGGDPDWREIERQFMEEAQPHFAFMWERLGEPEQHNITRIAEGKSVDRKYLHISEELERRGYLREEGSDYVVFSEPFARFALQQGSKGGRGGLFGLFKRRP
jgi:serine/threonine protein kinase